MGVTINGAGTCQLQPSWSFGPWANTAPTDNQIAVGASCSGFSAAFYFGPIPEANGTTSCLRIWTDPPGSDCRPSGTLTVRGSEGSYTVDGDCLCNDSNDGLLQAHFSAVPLAVN